MPGRTGDAKYIARGALSAGRAAGTSAAHPHPASRRSASAAPRASGRSHVRHSARGICSQGALLPCRACGPRPSPPACMTCAVGAGPSDEYLSRRCCPLSIPSLLPSHAHPSPSPPVQHGRPVCHSSHRRYRRFALLHHEHSVSEFASTSLAPGDAQFTPAPDIAVNRPLSAISRPFHGLAAHVRSSYSLHVFA